MFLLHHHFIKLICKKAKSHRNRYQNRTVGKNERRHKSKKLYKNYSYILIRITNVV